MLNSYLQKKAMHYFQKIIQENMQKEPRSNTSILAQTFSVGGVFFLAIFLICQYDAVGQPDILSLLFILYSIALYLYFQIVWLLKHSFLNFFHSLFYKRYYKKYGQITHYELLDAIAHELYIKTYKDEKDNLSKVIAKPKEATKIKKVNKI
jgi:hypothetical protein